MIRMQLKPLRYCILGSCPDGGDLKMMMKSSTACQLPVELINTALLKHFAEFGAGLPVPSLVLDIKFTRVARPCSQTVSLQQIDNSDQSG